MLAGKLRSRCCGLIEINDVGPRGFYNEPVAKFLHRTVYDYLQNPLISEKLNSICKVEARDLDHCLLAACSFLTEHSAVDAGSFHLLDNASASAGGYLTACVQYAEALNNAGDTAYIKLLCTADEYLRVRCDVTLKHQSVSETALALYNEAWVEALSRTNLSEICNHSWITKHTEPGCTSLYAASQLGIEACVEALIKRSDSVREYVIATVMQLFNMICESGSNVAKKRNCVRAVQLIFSNMSNDSRDASYSVQLAHLWSMWSDLHLTRYKSLKFDSLTTEKLTVTLSLLRAVKLHRLYEQNSYPFEQELTDILNSHKNMTIDTEQFPMIIEILSLLRGNETLIPGINQADDTNACHAQYSPPTYMHTDLLIRRSQSSTSCQKSPSERRSGSLCLSSCEYLDATGTISLPSDGQSQLIPRLKRLYLNSSH